MGKIIVEAGAYPQKHEFYTAEVLALAYGNIIFRKQVYKFGAKNPDILMGGILWEIKSPKTRKMSGIEQCLKRASKQSAYIIVDSGRVKGLKDDNILKFLENKVRKQKTIKRLIFVNKGREIFDIK